MKKVIMLVLALILVISVSACKKEETNQPGVDDKGAVNRFCYAYEGDRLYCQDINGENLTELGDTKVLQTLQKDNYVVYTVEDDGMYLMDLTDETSVKVTDKDAVSFEIADGFVVYALFDVETQSNSLYSYNSETGETTQIVDSWQYGGMRAQGTSLVYTDALATEDDYKSYVMCYDLVENKESWRVECEYAGMPSMNDSTVFIPLSVDDDTDGQDVAWHELDLKNGDKKVSGYKLLQTDTVVFIGSGGIWVTNYDIDGSGIYFVTTEGRQLVFDFGVKMGIVQYLGSCGNKALIARTMYNTYEPLMYEYPEKAFMTLDGETDVAENITSLGKYGQMFKDGDFPLMDSSTARKPLTTAIYSFFCLERDIPGATPLCSTTHNAWLNIADKKVDIALLAVPTQEEQDYLKEKGVEVEMKLYGGDGLVFIGNDACGVTDLTIEEIKAIYRGEITNWKELGGVDHEIEVLYRDPQSGSQRLFEQLVWGEDEELPDFEALGFNILDDMSTIVMYCRANPYAIGYSIMTYLKDTYDYEELQAFSVNGYEPTQENVESKNYPFATRGYVVIRSDEPEDSPARRLYNWFGSSVCDDILQANGITPISDEGSSPESE